MPNSRPPLPDEIILKLKAAAQTASANAYCTYSHFPVGAAILADSGEIFAGCNVENASYGLTMCAERSAIFHAVAAGSRRIRAVLIFTPTHKPAAPCGACRQVIHEFGPDAEIISTCLGVKVTRHMLSSLLPEAFGHENLPVP